MTFQIGNSANTSSLGMYVIRRTSFFNKRFSASLAVKENSVSKTIQLDGKQIVQDLKEELENQVSEVSPLLPPKYEPKYIENKWYQFWNTRGLFLPHHERQTERQAYTAVASPVKITSELNLNDALLASF